MNDPEKGYSEEYRKRWHQNRFLSSESFYLKKLEKEKNETNLNKEKYKYIWHILFVLAFLFGFFLPIVMGIIFDGR